ncbi:hypothetical protein [Granulicella mallensis]|jgi:hypothetical protein|uniref:Uncharacterized protein n=1 Tax=Granulicella mallensis (strain ATCC BAA-1857 / DSM 23137 / MP5ACTX8) TaxID=682795 RepID=G8P1Y6_GRAMM|nr:hypothetical protein [Granulicella mallensis]AEU37038.1 hypothetical protein AciX8_2728 [Granulicella mallensis MP5ACTX8]
MDLASKIRSIAKKKHVEPALRAGQRQFSIAVRDLMDEAEAEGITTAQRTPPFCTSIQTQGFLRDNGLEVLRVDGPASKKSTTVVVHYRVAGAKKGPKPAKPKVETAEQRAFRLTEKLRGLLKDELAEYGGGEAFIKWVRSDEEQAA